MLSATLLLTGMLVVGQAGQAENPIEEFGKLLEGRWIGEVTLIADWPGIGKQGEKVATHVVGRWIADRRAIEEEWYGAKGTGKNLYVWDGAAKQIKQYCVDSGGTTSVLVYTKRGDKWAFKASGSQADGTKMEGEGTLTMADGGNTQIYEGKYFMNGKELPPLNDVYRRVSR